MSSDAWLDYESGALLGSDSDGEMRLHDDGAGNLFILGWRPESESGEYVRAGDYDGSLSPEATEALRLLLNKRAGGGS